MSLPTLVAPEYPIKLVSLPKPIMIRPWLVKEEKLLLMAQHGEDKAEIESAVKQIIRNCTNGSVDVNTLPTFDLEYVFLQLRAKSVNNIVETKFECQNQLLNNPGMDGSEMHVCGTLVPVTINLDDIKLIIPEGHTNKVQLTDDIGIILKYPTVPVLEIDGLDLLSLLTGCLDKVFDKSGQVWEASEESPAEIKEFIESISVGQVDKIKLFFETMPKLDYTFTFKCPKCKYEEDITLSGLADFFD